MERDASEDIQRMDELIFVPVVANSLLTHLQFNAHTSSAWTSRKKLRPEGRMVVSK